MEESTEQVGAPEARGDLMDLYVVTPSADVRPEDRAYLLIERVYPKATIP